MKTLYFIGGTMGVGKTAVSEKLKTSLPNAVFLDGDWCWNANPFVVTDETKAMVIDNICYLLNKFLHLSAYENIIFCWVMHEQAIIDGILDRLDTVDCRCFSFSLSCSEKALRERLEKDIANGILTEDIISRSLPRLPMYTALNTVKIDTDGKTICQIADEIVAYTEKGSKLGKHS